MIGEDIDFSLRVREAGMETKLYRDAFVYHKRRVNIRKFYQQTHTFGKARIVLTKAHPGSLKVVHLLPMAFVLGHLLLLVLAIAWSPLWLLFVALYMLLLFLDSWRKNGSVRIALLSVVAAYAQLFGYGMGFMEEALTGHASKELKGQEKLYK